MPHEGQGQEREEGVQVFRVHLVSVIKEKPEKRDDVLAEAQKRGDRDAKN